jgi:murein DD-endopeptidase MepM/ murein hydrolase activator NlpD
MVLLLALPPAPQWTWPLPGPPAVTRGFEPPPRPWLAGHRGVDLAGHPDEPVRAAGAGVVAFAGVVAGRGVVSVDHAGGLRTTYEPVTSTVEQGTTVALGQEIGTWSRAIRAARSTPACTGDCAAA